MKRKVAKLTEVTIRFLFMIIRIRGKSQNVWKLCKMILETGVNIIVVNFLPNLTPVQYYFCVGKLILTAKISSESLKRDRLLQQLSPQLHLIVLIVETCMSFNRLGSAVHSSQINAIRIYM